jgi:hypothetical protein
LIITTTWCYNFTFNNKKTGDYNMSKTNFNKLHNNIGKVLCGFAGAIVGFIVGGPLLAIPGVLIGAVGGNYLEQQFA